LLDNQAWDRIGDQVAETDFYRDEHRRIFRQIRKLLDSAKPADVVTVAEALMQRARRADGRISLPGRIGCQYAIGCKHQTVCGHRA
jgi:replicative DNA helicase